MIGFTEKLSVNFGNMQYLSQKFPKINIGTIVQMCYITIVL